MDQGVYLEIQPLSNESQEAEGTCSPRNFSDAVCSTETEYIGYMYVFTPIVILGVILNVTNIAVFSRIKVKSSTMTYLLVLAISDMITLFISAPLGATRCVPTDIVWQQWARGVYEIYLFLPIANFTSTVSVWLTFTMSLDRYLHIRQSIYHKPCMPRLQCRHLQRWIIVSYFLVAAAINIPYFFSREMDSDHNVIDTEFSESQGFEVYHWFRFIFIKVLPIILIAVANALLIKVMVDISKGRLTLVTPFSTKKRHHRVQGRVSVMLVSISVVFLLCHVIEPLSHTPLYSALFGHCAIYSDAHLIQILVTNTLEMFSYGSNFVFYCVFHKKFRRVLAKAVCWCCLKQNKVGEGNSMVLKELEDGVTAPS